MAGIMLNLGCGPRTHPDWINIDKIRWNEDVTCLDLRAGIPYPDESVDVVYHSHLLEHLSRAEGVTFMRECGRVLKRGGVVRVVVPDLEEIVTVYLDVLARLRTGPGTEKDWKDRHEWMLMELYDQAVREKAGGEMIPFLAGLSPADRDFVVQRAGSEAGNMARFWREREEEERDGKMEPGGGSRRLCRIAGNLLRRRGSWRELLLRKLLGKEYEMLRVGRFRRSGEVHQWMYDGVELKRRLEEAGFREVRRETPAQSRIAAWESYRLDMEAGGGQGAFKPGSLIMEGIKP